jgi:hypothetical protein
MELCGNAKLRDSSGSDRIEIAKIKNLCDSDSTPAIHERD